MNIIVTGGAGFIGSNFVFHMLQAHPEYRIVCLDKLTYAGNLSTLEPVMTNANFRFVKADICDRAAVYQLFEEERPDIVVNFAAESHVDRSIENPGIFLETNIMGTAVLMDACRKYGITRYIRYRRTKYTAICPWIGPTCSLRKIRRFTRPAHTAVPRLRLTCWCWRIIGRIAFP